jgi:tetratricopeptide (TPR) repeat protein
MADEGELPPELRALLEESEGEPPTLLVGEEKHPDQEMADDLAEAEFYLSQGMEEEARTVLQRMQARAGEHPAVMQLRAKLAAAGPAPVAPSESPEVAPAEAAEPTLEPQPGPPEPNAPAPADDALLLGQGLERFPGLEDLGTAAALLETPAPLWAGEAPAPETSPAAQDAVGPGSEAGAPPAVPGSREPALPKVPAQAEASSADTADFVDLGKELEAEMAAEEQAAAADRGGALVNELLQEFQKGVREHLDEKDFETHYNLGMAYKEMDLYDEAVQEFRLAAGDPERALTCADLVGLCYLAKGDPAQAIRDLKGGLGLFGRPPEAYHSLRYDLGLAYEAHGDLGLALECYETLQRENARFRDVQTRTKRLRDQLRAAAAESPPAPPPAAPPAPAAPKPAKRTASKKKISFV